MSWTLRKKYLIIVGMSNEFLTNWFRSEPKEYPYGTKMFSATKQLILFFMGWIGFRIISTIIQVVLVALVKSNSLPIDFIDSYALIMTINTTSYLTLLMILLLVSNVDLAKLGKSFTQIQSFLAGVACLIAIFGFDYLYSIFVYLLRTPVTNNINETTLVSLETLYPAGALIIFGFIGPICEELTYRVGLFSFFRRKSRKLAYIVTMIVFAFIHFNFSTTSLLNEILNLPFYAFAAFAFSYAYERFGFAASLTAHILNNVISIAFIKIIH